LRLRVLWATLSVAILAIAYFLIAFYFFDRGTLLDMLYPPFALALAFLAVNLYTVTAERL
jgi:hypothetical protein